MRTFWRAPFTIFLVLFLSSALTACGSDDVKSKPGDDAKNQSDNSDLTNQDELEDCEDGQMRNPITGACVDDIDDEQNQSLQCSPGERFNPITGDCESNSGGSTECAPGEVLDPDSQTCVPSHSTECGLGAVRGQACTPSGETLAAASVTITGLDCTGQPFIIETTADGAGNYHLDNIPAGDHEVFVSSGSFTGDRTVRIRDGETTDLSGEAEKVCVSGEDVKIMVLQGSNENMGILLDNMGLDFDYIPSSGANTARLLEDLPRLMDYDILFFECNHTFSSTLNQSTDRERVIRNLRAFVESGKSLYAADNAYQWVDEPFPDLATFGDTASSEVVTADVMSTDMFTLLGKDQVEIDFDLGGMRVIESVSPDVNLHFRSTRGGQPNSPLMFSYQDPNNNGTVIYTSFHSSKQGGASNQDILDILNFLIFQL